MVSANVHSQLKQDANISVRNSANKVCLRAPMHMHADSVPPLGLDCDHQLLEDQRYWFALCVSVKKIVEGGLGFYVFATDSGVELVVPKKTSCQFHQAARDSVCPMGGGSVKLLGRTMGSCPELRSETMPDP